METNIMVSFFEMYGFYYEFVWSFYGDAKVRGNRHNFFSSIKSTLTLLTFKIN